jgi:hypothetical protein
MATDTRTPVNSIIPNALAALNKQPEKSQLNALANPAEPANNTVKDVTSRTRIPMSIPIRKLECGEIPGYHLFWFLDMNVPRARQGGYELVELEELPINQRGLANDSTLTGSSGLGGNIEVINGIGAQGQLTKLVLMKIPLQWYLEDQKLLENRNQQIVDAIFKQQAVLGAEKQSATDQAQTYVKTAKILNRGLKKQA